MTYLGKYYSGVRQLKPFIAKHYNGPRAGIDYGTESKMHRPDFFTNGNPWEIVLLCDLRWNWLINSFRLITNTPKKTRCLRCEAEFMKREAENEVSGRGEAGELADRTGGDPLSQL